MIGKDLGETVRIGINDIYQMGAVDTIISLINCFGKKSDVFYRDDLIAFLESYKKSELVIDVILKNFE